MQPPRVQKMVSLTSGTHFLDGSCKVVQSQKRPFLKCPSAHLSKRGNRGLSVVQNVLRGAIRPKCVATIGAKGSRPSSLAIINDTNSSDIKSDNSLLKNYLGMTKSHQTINKSDYFRAIVPK